MQIKKLPLWALLKFNKKKVLQIQPCAVAFNYLHNFETNCTHLLYICWIRLAKGSNFVKWCSKIYDFYVAVPILCFFYLFIIIVMEDFTFNFWVSSIFRFTIKQFCWKLCSNIIFGAKLLQTGTYFSSIDIPRKFWTVSIQEMQDKSHDFFGSCNDIKSEGKEFDVDANANIDVKESIISLGNQLISLRLILINFPLSLHYHWMP